ncbi:hypothetical protein ACFSCX_16735 [Bacillus salitolerans]|uniref:Uncharacterized protein n=1 Tax=Bacillus salitolerans TaxID=1437434 RepID=A0ABW4LVL6_9BACI
MSKNWRDIRKGGRKQFVLIYSLTLSLPLVMDYYIIKFFLRSYKLETSFMELLGVWVICLFLGSLFSLYAWRKMESWVEQGSGRV